MASSFLRVYSSAMNGWALNLKTDSNIVRGNQVDEDVRDYVNNHGTEISTQYVLNCINRILFDDGLENKSCTIENSTLEAAIKSFYDVLSGNLNSKYDTICRKCGYSNTEDLYEMESYLHEYKSSICSCNTVLGREGKNGSKLVRMRSFNSQEIEYEQWRSNKHMAVYLDDYALHKMFNSVLSLYGKKEKIPLLSEPEPHEENTRKGLSKREAVDLRNLLTQCTKNLAGNNSVNMLHTRKLLKQVRSRACVSGDGTERLAHYFANGLEARLGGGVKQHKKRTLKNEDADLWKAVNLYLTAFPFMETTFFLSNEMIMTLAEKKETTTLHVIHFGIMQGLQWPSFIESLSKRPRGPPRLRITGTDFPQDGLQTNAMIVEIRNRLSNICKKFNVSFEYNGFVKNWDTITLDDFKIEKNEVVVVNCLYYMMYLQDDTVVENNPRDVLRLIKSVNPDLFVHLVVNGVYNSPFFTSRFREALFHYSALFDMFDVNLPRGNQLRMVFERDIWGREITNVIACEGSERVERPETYKQWQLRTTRPGLSKFL